MRRIPEAHVEDLQRMQRFGVFSERTRIEIIIESKICKTRMRTDECSHDVCQAYVDLLQKIKPRKSNASS